MSGLQETIIKALEALLLRGRENSPFSINGIQIIVFLFIIECRLYRSETIYCYDAEADEWEDE